MNAMDEQEPELPGGADERFAHGLLVHWSRERQAERAARLAFSRIDRRPRAALWTSAALAMVAATIALVVLLRVEPHRTLAAEVQRVLEVARQPVDRRYEMSIEVGDGRTFAGVMTVRGDDHFVVAVATKRGTVTFGFDGAQSFLVPPLRRMPVFTTDGIAGARTAMTSEQVMMPFLNLTQALEQLPSDYELRLAASGDDAVRVLEATRAESADARLPEQATIELAGERGIVRELDLRWTGARAAQQLVRMKLTLRGEPQLREDFYRHPAHHAAGRRVRGR